MARKRKDMSDTVETPQAPAVEKYTATRKLFDLSKFEKVTKEAEYTFTPETDLAEALKRFTDEKLLIEVLNAELKHQALLTARKSISSDGLVSPKIISGFVAQFKPMFPAAGDSKEAKHEQRQKIYAFIRGNTGLMDLIKQYAATQADTGEDEDENETEDAGE